MTEITAEAILQEDAVEEIKILPRYISRLEIGPTEVMKMLKEVGVVPRPRADLELSLRSPTNCCIGNVALQEKHRRLSGRRPHASNSNESTPATLAIASIPVLTADPTVANLSKCAKTHQHTNQRVTAYCLTRQRLQVSVDTM